MAVGDVYQLSVIGSLHGQQTVNVLHYQVTVSTGTNMTELIALQWIASCKDAYRACCAPEYTMTGVTCQRLKPIPALTAGVYTTTPGAGTTGANSLPSSVAAVITKRTAIAGRKGRGRIFMPGVPTTFEDNSTVTGAGLNSYNALGLLLLEIAPADEAWKVALCLLNKKTLSSSLVVTCEARPILRNQRRRQVGRGA